MAKSILVRVKLLGSGTGGDAYRVNLPTYAHIHGDVTDGYAIVSIPLDILGLSDDDLKGEPPHQTTEGPLYMILSDDNLKKAQDHLDSAYPDKGHALELVSG